VRFGCLLTSALLIFPASCTSDRPSSESDTPLIAVVPKGTTHLFWRTIEAGAREAAADLGVEILWKGPLKENDRAQQIALVEQLVTQGVAGIVLAPLDDTALLRPVRSARQRGIPVLIFDTGLKGTPGVDFISFVAADNYAAGRLAGERLAAVLENRGSVGVLRYQVGSGSTTAREEGFLDYIREQTDIEVTLENVYGGVTVGEIIQKCEEILDRLRTLDGVFCPTEPTTSALLIALRKHGLAGRIRIAGFDSSEQLLQALETGEIDSLVLQEPRKMAYQAVETMVRHLSGHEVAPRVETATRIIARGDLNDPKVRALLGLD
jgi:ribose transport system substrate-binding protein